jgi:tetratricopeptide (TPR) repeat protein
MLRLDLSSLPSAVSTFAAAAAAGLLLSFATPAVSDPGGAPRLLPAESRQQKADEANHEGLAAQNRHDLIASIRTFKQALDLSTKDDSIAIVRQNLAVSYAMLGKEAYDRGDYAGAADLFKQALPLVPAAPDIETIRYNIGESYYHAARDAHDRRDLTRELDLLDAAREYDHSASRQAWLDRVRDEIVGRREAIENIRFADIPPAAEASAAPVRQQLAPGPGVVGAPASGPAPVIVTPGAPIPIVVPFGAPRAGPPAWPGPRVVQMPQRFGVPAFVLPQRPFVGRPAPFVAHSGRR